MDDFLNGNKQSGGDIIDDNKIEFKFYKEKRTSRTYIYNLEKYIIDPSVLISVIKKLKKTLATSCMYKEKDQVKDIESCYGFQGDHKKKIIEFLLKSELVSINDFKKSDMSG